MKICALNVLVFLILFSLTSCDKRAPVRQQIELTQADLVTKQALSTKIQDELKTQVSLGKYNFAGASQIQKLRGDIEKSTAKITQLKTEKLAAEAVNQKLRQETEAYLTAHAKR
jgi:hypothetical protein